MGVYGTVLKSSQGITMLGESHIKILWQHLQICGMCTGTDACSVC